MARAAGKDCYLFVDGYKLASDVNSVSVLAEATELEDTVQGDTYRSRISGGLKNGVITLSGIWDDGTGRSDPQLNTFLGTSVVVGLFMGGTAADKVVKAISGELQPQYGQDSPLAGLVTVNARFLSDQGGIFQSRSLGEPTSITATGNGTAVDNAASSANGARGFLWLYQVATVATIAIKIRHSTDNISYADLINFTLGASVGAESLTASGTVNRYTRVEYTVTGSPTGSWAFAVALARL